MTARPSTVAALLAAIIMIVFGLIAVFTPMPWKLAALAVFSACVVALATAFSRAESERKQ